MMEYHVHTASERGELSEDRAVAIPVPDGLIVAVADGVGGIAGGGLAAQFAVETISHLSPESAIEPDELSEIDRALFSDTDLGETTLVAMKITREEICGASVGDSEAWWVTKDRCVRLTEDQQRKPFLGSGEANPVSFQLRIDEAGTLVVATDGLFGYGDAATLVNLARSSVPLPDIALAQENAARGKASGRLWDDLAIVLVRFMA